MRLRHLIPVVLSVLSVPCVVAAQGYGLRNPLGSTNIPQIIGRVVSWFGVAGGALFLLYLIWGGVEWMTAGGNEGKAKQARGRIQASIMGIAVILLAYLAVATIIGLIPG